MELDGEKEEEEDCDPLKRKRAIKDLFKKWKLLEKISEYMKVVDPKSASASEVLEKLLMLQHLQALEYRYVGRKPIRQTRFAGRTIFIVAAAIVVVLVIQFRVFVWANWSGLCSLGRPKLYECRALLVG